ncbi:MAG TPA: hypothetical protein DCW31_10590 [Lactobacillus sp.]|nr:hypothetical protein [Lactobacillus sp.]
MTIRTTTQLVTLFSDPQHIHSRQFTKSHRLIIISAALIDLLAAHQITFKKIGSKQLVTNDEAPVDEALNLMTMFIKVHEPTLQEVLSYYSRVQHFSRLIEAIISHSSLAKTIIVEQGGFLNNKDVYVATSASLKRVEDHIQHLLLAPTGWTDKDVAFLTLYEAGNLGSKMLTQAQRVRLREQLAQYTHAPENEFVFSALRSLLALSDEIIAS